MEDTLICCEKLLVEGGSENTNTEQFYKIFCECKLENDNENSFCEYIFPKVYELCEKNLIQKDILYLSLIANGNEELLEKCIEYEKTNFVLDPRSSSSLYDYCIYAKSHWFEEVAHNYTTYTNLFSDTVYNKILTVALVYLSNKTEIDLQQIKCLIEMIDTSNLDDFWKYYMEEIKRLIQITEFCQKWSKKINPIDVFVESSRKCILGMFSDYLDFQNVGWDEVFKEISENTKTSQKTCEKSHKTTFFAFSILATVLNVLIPVNSDNSCKSYINHVLEILKNKLLNINDNKLQIELLENIFVLLFMENDCIFDKTATDKNNVHVCTEKEIRFVLFLLKSVMDEIKLKKLYSNKECAEYKRFMDLDKYVSDAMWRMELIVNVKKIEKCEKNLLKYMLASSSSLIQMCIKQADFLRAHQVIQIFELEGTTLSYEISYTEKLLGIKENLKRTFRMKAIQKVNPSISFSSGDLQISKTLDEFLKYNPPVINRDNEDILDKFAVSNDFLSHYKSENEIFMNMLDLAITQPKTYEDCEEMLQIAFEHNTLGSDITSNYSKFSKNLLELFKEVGANDNLSISNIFLEPRYNFDITRYKKQEEFYYKLAQLCHEFNDNLSLNEPGVLNNNHPAHKSFLKLNTLCNEYVEDSLNTKDNIRYLSKLYNYLKAFSKVLYIEKNSSDIVSQGKNASYFELLSRNRSELIGKLLFEKHLDPSEFEKYFGKLKLDYLYHVIGNCFPTINLHTQEKVTADELFPENNLYIPSKAIITYIQKRNWLLAFILTEMFNVKDIKIDLSEARIVTFLNYLKLPKVQCLKVLYEENEIITALQNEISYKKLSDYIHEKILKHEMLSCSVTSHSSDIETAEELLEDAWKTTNWKALYDLIESVPENQIKKNPELVDLKDMILANLVSEGFEYEFYKYVQYIHDRKLRINVILENFKKWPGEFCVFVLKSEITKFNVKADTRLSELRSWLQQIEVCEKFKDILNTQNWAQAYELCMFDPQRVLTKLLGTDKIESLIDYINIYEPDKEYLLEISYQYLVKIFESEAPFEHIKTLLDHLSYEHSHELCHNLLKTLRKLNQLRFIVDYLLQNDQNHNLRNVEFGLKMLSVFSPREHDQLLCLLDDPLSIVETLIINTKLDQLSSVLEVIKSEISNSEFDENVISVEKIDELLRIYAEKSLDFRIITQPNPRLLRTPECKLMQSLDSLNLGYDSRGFLMPDVVPSKDEWVKNDEVLECMCCQNVTFSMFNRRHHCRRCGRIICYNCSLKRMLVQTYGDILVRVCDDCYTQTNGSVSTSTETNDAQSSKSVAYDFWILTDDPVHNGIIREEFSFEHAPSVSLCLSIMKYHSKTESYPKFLLEQCELLLKLLLPSQEPIQEIDYLLVIKMLKSLALAAKMTSQECTLHYGSSLADRILSQADLLSLLAERGCLNLLPVSSHSQGSYIDASVLRRLRDRLLEREQWNLALEVSTKAGLDNTGVFVAWGKSCLKAGSLLIAREKFARCLDKSGHYEAEYSGTELDVSSDTLARSRNWSRASNLSSLSDGSTKPARNPPLLNEIVHILENKTEVIDMDVFKEIQAQKMSTSMLSLNQSLTLTSQPDAAICILNKLKNLKNIAAGIYMPEKKPQQSVSNRPPIDAIFFEECVYYLTRYGTHLSLLEFFIKHRDVKRALYNIIDNKLSTDIFSDIYMRCLKDGIIDKLHTSLSEIDSRLDVWKDYLKQICCHLEKQNMLNSLYQLQQYMGDYIRAAMTCIRFYEDNVYSFADLLSNINFLQRAEEHLKQVLEQEQWVEVASVKSSASKDSFEEKALTNPCLVMKVNPKDIDKHIKSLKIQREVNVFLADCENYDIKPMDILAELIPDALKQPDKKIKIPTLFGSNLERKYLAVLAIVCSRNVEEGFDMAIRIIKEFKLKPITVYNEVGKQFAKSERYDGIVQLISCIKKSDTSDNIITDMCDEMLTLAVATFTKANVTGTRVEDLIKLISDRATKISAYIEAKQLKTAYFLAVKYKRISDIRRILREAELLNQPNIKALCQKVLQSHSHNVAQSKE